MTPEEMVCRGCDEPIIEDDGLWFDRWAYFDCIGGDLELHEPRTR